MFRQGRDDIMTKEKTNQINVILSGTALLTDDKILNNYDSKYNWFYNDRIWYGVYAVS